LPASASFPARIIVLIQASGVSADLLHGFERFKALGRMALS
jgi:hypothetical protein